MNTKKTIKVLSGLVLAGCLITVQQAGAQTWSTSVAGDNLDRWVVNKDNTNFWSYLRLQVSNNRAWNIINEGDLWWGYDTSGDHFSRGTERMRLTSDGKLGIGTASPQNRLTVYDGELSLQTNDNTEDQGLVFQNSGGAYTWRMYRTDTGNSEADLRFAGGIVSDFTQLTDIMTLQNNGNVGIGTSDPNAILSLGTPVQSKMIGLHDNPAAWYGLGIDDYTMRLQVGNSSARFAFYAGDNTEVMRIQGDGNVGIGTTSPEDRLTVYDGELSLRTDDNTENQGLVFQNSAGAYTWRMYRTDAGSSYANLKFAAGLESDFTDLTDVMTLQNDGNVGIGQANPTEKLEVSGNIKADGVILNIGSFPDYVFEKDYPLMPLSEVEKYIKANKHLPGFPSEAEVIKNGASLGELNNLLVEKVEELTLHSIAQEKLLNTQEKQINMLLEALNTLKAEVKAMKKQ